MSFYGYDHDEAERQAWLAKEEAKAARVPRDLTCPTCKRPNALTPFEAKRGYQCNRCADLEEGVG